MQVKFFCPIWGMVPDYVDRVDGSLADIFSKVKNAGYDGIEMAIPLSSKQKGEIKKLLPDLELQLIALQWAADGRTRAEYLDSYEKHMTSASEAKPLFINSHTAKDYFAFEDVCTVLERAEKISTSLGVKIVHETHRGKFSFHSATIQKYLTAYPALRLTADFSHWCNVSESYLQDQKENVDAAIGRTEHIHARVGHPQSCQVSDPRAPEWKEALDHHLAWWDAIVLLHREKGTPVLTITPEFGPGNYMPLMPYTKKPLADQWEINIWIRDLLKKRYEEPAVI